MHVSIHVPRHGPCILFDSIHTVLLRFPTLRVRLLRVLRVIAFYLNHYVRAFVICDCFGEIVVTSVM